MSEENNLNEMLLLKREKLQDLRDAGKDPYKVSTYDVTEKSSEIKENYDDYEGKEVSVAGRIMSKRGHGKVGFVDLQDSTGRIQLFIKINNLTEESYEEYKTYDIGDLVGVKGEVFKTKTEEVSVRVSDIKLLSKSLQILPEKFHGLKDTDLRYRQRYVDLIVNPEVKETFVLRSRIVSAIREFLDNKGFLEVETPILNTIAGGATARPFTTHHNTLDIDMYLRIANELYLKRLIVGGFDKVYEMGRMFRNEGMSVKHNPEYTAMELYQAYTDYHGMMEITENLVAYVAEKVIGTTKINYQGKELDFTPPWRRVSMQDLVKEHAGVDFDKIETDEEAIAVAKEKGIELTEANRTRGHIINEFFEEFCEQHLEQPTFVLHHPVEVSPLAKRNAEDERITDRFEAFVNAWEIANAFSELNDPIDQKARFEDQLKEREQGNVEAQMMDKDFVNALEVGLPPTGGLGIGIDRLIMVLTNQTSIRDVILFPTMKPIGEKVGEESEESEENTEE